MTKSRARYLLNVFEEEAQIPPVLRFSGLYRYVVSNIYDLTLVRGDDEYEYINMLRKWLHSINNNESVRFVVLSDLDQCTTLSLN